MKFRKPPAVILVVALVQLTVSCTYVVRKSPSELAPNAKGYRVVRVEKTSGEILKFERGTVGRIKNQEIRFGSKAYPAIPLVEVSAVWTRVPNIVGTVLLVLGGGCVAYVAGIGLYLLITGKTLMGAFPF
jgi:hypothetical protein